MPRKISGNKRTKVISTKILDSEYTLICQYAKEYYLQGKVRQPNISQLLSYIITDWLDKFTKRKSSALDELESKKVYDKNHGPVALGSSDDELIEL